MSAPPSTELAASAPTRPSIATSAFLAGLCALSPIPFIDDLVIGVIRRRLVGRLFRAHGIPLSWGQARALTRTGRNWLLGCLGGVVVYPIRKIFRKVFYFLAVKEAVDVASRLLHQGLLVRHALDQGCVTAADLGGREESLTRLNRVVFQVCEDIDTSPINQFFRHGFASGRAFLRGLVTDLRSALRGEGDYLHALQQRFDAQWVKELEAASPPQLGDGEE